MERGVPFDIILDSPLQEIARRIHHLTNLYSVDVATYRQVINANQHDGSIAHPDSADYTKIDHDYVCILRKSYTECINAIVSMPGMKLTFSKVEGTLETYFAMVSHIAIPSYILENHRLVIDKESVTKSLWMYFEEICPRTKKTALCFSVAFLKQIIPSLMGDGVVAPLCEPQRLQESPLSNTCIDACILCKKRRRNVILMPCHHLVICSECSDEIQNTVCPVCDRPILNTEKIYTS